MAVAATGPGASPVGRRRFGWGRPGYAGCVTTRRDLLHPRGAGVTTAGRGAHPDGWRHELGEEAKTVGPRFLAWLVGLVVVVSALGLLLTRAFDDNALLRLDLRIARSLEAGRTPRLDDLTALGTRIADPIPVAVVWFGAMLVLGLVVRRWGPPVFMLVCVGGEKLTYLLSSLVVGRDRPPVQPLGEVHATSSFPSGHVGSAISLWAGLTLLVLTLLAGRLLLRNVVISGVVGVATGVLVAYCRMYSGHHFLTDVIVGAAVGVAWIAIAYHVVLRPDLDQHAGGHGVVAAR